MNIKNYQKVLNQIKSHPETWDQRYWESNCGTKYCFAGWAQRFLKEETKDYETLYESLLVTQAAKLYLDCGKSTLNWICSTARTLDDFETFEDFEVFDDVNTFVCFT